MLKILSVGQCAIDHARIVREVGRKVNAHILAAVNFEEAIEFLQHEHCELILVNRISDSDGSRGLDFIRTLKAEDAFSSFPVMLVSDYASAQQEAEGLGALPGIGKSTMSTEETQARLRAVLAGQTQT